MLLLAALWNLRRGGDKILVVLSQMFSANQRISFRIACLTFRESFNSVYAIKVYLILIGFF